MTRLLAEAQQGHYALCYCEAWNLESLQGIVEAAEESLSPVITGFNGGFLDHPRRARPENLAFYAKLSTALAFSSIPLAFMLNETDNLGQIEEGINLGFNAVMVENERLCEDEYRHLVRSVVALAHARNVAVEAQVGHLGDGTKEDHSGGEITDPGLARAFVEETGIDALAVSIGNVHILTQGKVTIDLDILRRIHEAVDVPLVIHGGTGFPCELAKEVIGLGVAKVNFGTALKQAYLSALRSGLDRYREASNPHPFLGMGGEEDILVAGREAVKREVKALLHTFGSAGKAKATG